MGDTVLVYDGGAGGGWDGGGKYFAEGEPGQLREGHSLRQGDLCGLRRDLGAYGGGT